MVGSARLASELTVILGRNLLIPLDLPELQVDSRVIIDI